MRLRLGFALACGLLCVGANLVFTPMVYGEAADFTWVWRGAKLLLAGVNPYTFHELYPFKWPLYYPLPALLVALPLSYLPPLAAGTIFTACSVVLLSYALLREGVHRLPLLLSAPFVTAVLLMQWSPLITAAYLLPGLLPLAICKPSIGLPVLLLRPSWRGYLATAGLLAVSLVVLPTWPRDWLANLGQHENFVPLLTLPGLLLLLALRHYRSREGQLLLLLAAMPQRYYDPLMLWLLPRTFRQGLLLSLLSWVGYLGWEFTRSGAWVVCFSYLPALAMLFWPMLRQQASSSPQPTASY